MNAVTPGRGGSNHTGSTTANRVVKHPSPPGDTNETAFQGEEE